jgi:hypothetical protein
MYECRILVSVCWYTCHGEMVNVYSVASLLGTPPCSQKWFTPTDSESLGRGLLYESGRQASRYSVTVHLNV